MLRTYMQKLFFLNLYIIMYGWKIAVEFAYLIEKFQNTHIEELVKL